MTSTSSRLSMAALAASLMLGSSLSAEAASLFARPALGVAPSNIITVQGAGAGPNESAAAPQFDRRGRQIPESQQRPDRRTYSSAGNDGPRRFDRSSGFERRGSSVYYNGHRGYRDRRSGYRYHDGFWFPAAAFAVGAILGGALVAPAPAPASNPHVDWCLSRYRSYNPYDNTFQPYGGPRVYCRSPYG